MGKSFFVWGLVCLVFSQAAVADSRRKPVVYDVTGLFSSPSGEIPLIGGKSVRLNLTWGTSKVLFEDKMPGANWEHPAMFRVVNGNGKVTQEVAVSRPPQNLEGATVLSGVSPFNAESPKFTLDTFGGKYKVADPTKYHAILINGHADLRHWNDHSFLYRVLTQIYGYDRANIIVVDGVYKDSKPDLDEDGKNDIAYSSTIQGITDAMTALKEKVKPGDSLLLSVNDHGGRIGNESTIIAYDGEVKASEFAKLLSEIKAEKVLTLYEQCHSGGFVRPSTGRNRVSMAAAREDEYSWASTDLNWDEWIYHVIVAFARQTHDGKAVDADKNRDDRISVTEAFSYSVAQDVAFESPLLESHANTGTAINLGVNF